MMASKLENDRLNIRIEIKNNAEEPMDIDEIEENKSEEEGEIRDTLLNGTHNYKTISNVFGPEKKNLSDGISNFLDLDHKKLNDRAKRFSLKPNEMNSFTEDDLRDLYISLGITSENIDDIRFEAVHLRSSDDLTAQEATNYFIKYAPISVEMIDEESYNIVWENKLTAARALFLTSQVVSGMPVRNVSEHVIDNFILDDQDSSKEVGLLNEFRQIELSDENTEEYKKLLSKNSIDISVINIPIPPGYWRLGKENIHSYSVLLRFSLKTDRKPQLVEKCSKYSKVNIMKGNSRQHNKGIFSRNKDINSDNASKDPWGVLAKNWNEDYKFREPERSEENLFIEKQLAPAVPINSELRVRLTAKRRLGKIQVEEIQKSSSEKEQSEESDQENSKKKSKIPRMRMYADEEEEKIKRRKLLSTLKNQSEKLEKTEIANSDLRNILRITNRKPKVRADFDEGLDLSLNLQNRKNKLVFAVAQDPYEVEHEVKEPLHKLPKKERRFKSPIRFKRNSPEDVSRSRRRDFQRQQYLVEKPQRRLYSTREDRDKYDSHKPRSKVALVIKTQKIPSVASTVRSRNRKFDTTSSSSEKDSSDSSSSSEESSEETDSSSSEDSDSLRNRKNNSPNKKLSINKVRVRSKNDYVRK